jgi:hypothetical protein
LGFYEKVLKLLQMEDGRAKKTLFKKILADVPKGLSWKCDEHKLRKIMRSRYDLTQIGKRPCGASREFMVAVFRDVSPIDTDHKREVFKRLRAACGIERTMFFVFASSVVKRKGGGATFTIEATSLEGYLDVSRFIGDGDLRHLISLRDGGIVN